jgi:hypothetical protein
MGTLGERRHVGEIPAVTTTSVDHTRRGRPDAGSRPVVLGGGLGAMTVAIYVIARPGPGADVVVAAAPVSAGLAILAAILAFRPRRWFSWALVGVGCVIHTWSVAVLMIESSGDSAGKPGAAQAIAVLAYPALFCGVMGITARNPDGWATRLGTALLAACVGTTVSFLAFWGPLLVDDQLPFSEGDWVGILALADLTLAALALRAVRHEGRPIWSNWLLLAGFVAWGIAHGEVGGRLYDHAFHNGSVAAGLLLIGPILIGLAALVPEMADEPDPDPVRSGSPTLPSGVRLASIGVPSAVLLVVHTLRAGQDPARALVALLAIGVVTFTLRRLRKLQFGEI